jgi:hypothetical protein
MKNTILSLRSPTFILCMLAFVVSVHFPSSASAQGCYTRTDDFGWGTYFVHAVSDSTCFEQSRDSVFLSNVRNGEVYLRFFAEPWLTRMHQFDSILVLHEGKSFRLLRMTDRGTAVPMTSVMDSSGTSGIPDLQTAKCDSFLVVWKPPVLHQYKVVRNTVSFVDSIALRDDDYWSTIGLVGDTIVISPFMKYVKRFHVSGGGIRFIDSIPTNKGFPAPPEIIFFHNGTMYCYAGDYLLRYVYENGVFVRKNELVHPTSLTLASLGQGLMPTADALLAVGSDRSINVFDWELNKICSLLMSGFDDYSSCSNYGSKIFLASMVKGITTYLPAVTSYAETADRWSAAHSLSVYPNPSTNGNVVTLHGARSIDKSALFDATGRAVDLSLYTYRIHGEKIELRYHVPPGVYFLRVSHDARQTTERVVIIPR